MLQRNDLKNSLNTCFGFDTFREGQAQTITQLLNGQSTLSIFPTGSGKSLCYQFTATQLPHLTLVVSPLLALIKDQLAFLASKGIAAASIDSSLKGNEAQQVMSQVRSGELKILMVSVERFKNERFREFIQSIPISMLVVDEAHCISEWGHNFRPDYLKLPEYRKRLNIDLVLLLTATATKKVKQDMAAKFDIDINDIVQTGFYRNNLDLSVVPVDEKQKNSKLLSLIQQQQGAGIIYVTLQQSAEAVANFLIENRINAAAYHAGFDNDKRQSIQDSFMQGSTQVIVATIAFGMGIDKADIRFVVHYDLPKSIENYSQEIGRAGRDGLPSTCITLANLDGLTTVENFVYGDTPELPSIEKVIETIKNESISSHNNHRWELQGLQLVNASNIRQLPLKTLLVQLELAGIIEPIYTYFADFRIKLQQPLQQIMAEFDADRQKFLQTIFNHVSFKKIWGSLHFNELLSDPLIERNRVVAALNYLDEQQFILLETKGVTEVFNIDMKKLLVPDVSQNLAGYFADKEQKEIQRIATLIRFFELNSCLNVNLSKYFDDPTMNEKFVSQGCGHCSVCRGNIAHLKYSYQAPWPDDQYLVNILNEFINTLTNKTQEVTSLSLCCRFLSGMTMPLFTRYKVRQMKGFGCCNQLRYAEITSKIETLRGKYGLQIS